MFIALAFLNKRLAYYNLYFIVPGTYIVHILPFHIIEWLKDKVREKEPDRAPEQLVNESQEKPGPSLISRLNIPHYFDKYCFRSPFSAQGLLVFGAVSSAYVLKK